MTKTLPERFAELIEMIILALEAHLLASYLPNRLAAPLSWRVRSSLEGFSSKFTEVFAKFLAAAAAKAAAEAARSLKPAPELCAQFPAQTPRKVKASRPARTAGKRRRINVSAANVPCARPTIILPSVATHPPGHCEIIAMPRRTNASCPAARPRKPPNRKNGSFPHRPAASYSLRYSNECTAEKASGTALGAQAGACCLESPRQAARHI